jgi:mono/diheme cytochrome c family protein
MRNLLCSFAIFISACSSTPAAPLAPSAETGRKVYLANCIACHSADPNKDGPLGPAVQGASTALLEARVLRAEYPAGYQPKRETKMMTPLPHLKGSIDDLALFLK